MLHPPDGVDATTTVVVLVHPPEDVDVTSAGWCGCYIRRRMWMLHPPEDEDVTSAGGCRCYCTSAGGYGCHIRRRVWMLHPPEDVDATSAGRCECYIRRMVWMLLLVVLVHPPTSFLQLRDQATLQRLHNADGVIGRCDAPGIFVFINPLETLRLPG